MKTIITTILICFIAFSTAIADSVKVSVAKIDYGEIDELLVKVVLNMDGNEELRERFTAKEKAAKEAQDKMQTALLKGEPMNPMEAAASFMHDDADKKKVDQLCQKHLLELIERVFDDKYEIVFKDDFRSSLLYTRAAIDDVTIIIKQELLKAIPNT